MKTKSEEKEKGYRHGNEKVKFSQTKREVRKLECLVNYRGVRRKEVGDDKGG